MLAPRRKQDRIVGISGYTVFPKRARSPGLCLHRRRPERRSSPCSPIWCSSFSNLQVDIGRALIQAGLPAYAFNQRSVDDILALIATVGRLVGAEGRALAMLAELQAVIDAVRAAAARLPRRPRVTSRNGTNRRSAASAGSREIAIAGGGTSCRSRDAASAKEPHHRRPAGGGAPRPGPHHWLLVRQAFPPRTRRRALAVGDSGCCRRADLRTEIRGDPQPRPGGDPRGLPALLGCFRGGRRADLARRRWRTKKRLNTGRFSSCQERPAYFLSLTLYGPSGSRSAKRTPAGWPLRQRIASSAPRA